MPDVIMNFDISTR